MKDQWGKKIRRGMLRTGLSPCLEEGQCKRSSSRARSERSRGGERWTKWLDHGEK